MIFSAFNGGIQAFDADTLESLWVYKDSVGGQSVSPIYYNDGCIYTGFCNYGAGKDDQYVCIDVKKRSHQSGYSQTKAVSIGQAHMQLTILSFSAWKMQRQTLPTLQE